MKQLAILCFGLLLGSGALCSADVIYNVGLNTSALVQNTNGPFALDFQLISGASTTGIVNSVTASNFLFGAGGAAGTGRPFANSGNASGNLNSSFVLNSSNGSSFNEFSQNFTPGTSLRFQLDLTNNAQVGPTPDEFSFYLIDGTGVGISTTDPGGSLFFIDLTGTRTAPKVFTTTGDNVSITPQLAAVPEPATNWMVLCASALCLGLRLGATGSLNRAGRSASDSRKF